MAYRLYGACVDENVLVRQSRAEGMLWRTNSIVSIKYLELACTNLDVLLSNDPRHRFRLFMASLSITSWKLIDDWYSSSYTFLRQLSI